MNLLPLSHPNSGIEQENGPRSRKSISEFFRRPVARPSSIPVMNAPQPVQNPPYYPPIQRYPYDHPQTPNPATMPPRPSAYYPPQPSYPPQTPSYPPQPYPAYHPAEPYPPQPYPSREREQNYPIPPTPSVSPPPRHTITVSQTAVHPDCFSFVPAYLISGALNALSSKDTLLSSLARYNLKLEKQREEEEIASLYEEAEQLSMIESPVIEPINTMRVMPSHIVEETQEVMKTQEQTMVTPQHTIVEETQDTTVVETQEMTLDNKTQETQEAQEAQDESVIIQKTVVEETQDQTVDVTQMQDPMEKMQVLVDETRETQDQTQEEPMEIQYVATTQDLVEETQEVDVEATQDQSIEQPPSNQTLQPSSRPVDSTLSQKTLLSPVIIDTSESSEEEASDLETVLESEEIPQPPTIVQIVDTSDSEDLFSHETPYQPKNLPESIRIDEEVLSTVEKVGNSIGPSGLPLFNLNRINKKSEEEPVHSRVTVQRTLSIADSSILISQLSQMDEPSSTSDDEDASSQALREGEKEVKQVTSFSLLSLMKMNKEVSSGVNASKQQQVVSKPPTVPALKARRASEPTLQNPREFLINYITKLDVQSKYMFQNSRNLKLRSVYKDIIEYTESMLFCIIEELAYIVTQSTAALLNHCGIRLSSSPQIVAKPNSNVEMAEAVVTEVTDTNCVTISIHKNASLTPYRWNEAVVLISTVNLHSVAAKSSLPPLSFGIITSADTATANREEWYLYVNLSKEMKSVLAVQNKIVLYSISTFTSYLREFISVCQARNKRFPWKSVLTQLNEDSSIPSSANHSHIPDTIYQALASQLNVYQMDVVTALSRPGLSGVYLVEGPPGTGKTTTIISTVQTLLSINTYTRILITAPSNAAVDTLLEKLILALPSASSQVVRLGRVGGDTHSKERAERYYLQRFELDHMVEKRIEGYRTNKKTAMNTETDGYLRKQFEEEILLKSRVIVSTLVTSANIQVSSFLSQGNQLPIVIVDEATQCTESQCIIPLVVKPSLFVLVGDSHQLAATIQNPHIDHMGYGKSLFERLEENHYPKLSLRVQYRMTPAICEWPNSYVYRGLLLNSKRVTNPHFRFLFNRTTIPSFAFIDLPTSTCERDHSSFRNNEEAEMISGLFKVLFSILPPSKADYSIGVIAPYVAQVHQIRKRVDEVITAHHFENERRFIKISSVDSFQGGESDIVILSCVRSKLKMEQDTKTVGFLSNIRRLNVALTRAKQALWIVGNPDYLQINAHWKALIEHTRERKAFWNKMDFMKCFETPVSLKTVKQEREANQQVIDNGDSMYDKGKRRRSVDENDYNKRRRF